MVRQGDFIASPPSHKKRRVSSAVKTWQGCYCCVPMCLNYFVTVVTQLQRKAARLINNLAQVIAIATITS